MKPLSRRSVTTGLAAAVTVIPALALPAIAQETDVELRRLWAEWLDAKANATELQLKRLAALRLVEKETAHLRCEYEFLEVRWVGDRKRGHWVAVESDGRDDRERSIPGIGRKVLWKAQNFAIDRIENEVATHRKARQAARARHNIPSIDAAFDAAVQHWNRVGEAILDTPAESIFGVGIKLAAGKWALFGEHHQNGWERRKALLGDVGGLVGVDFVGLTKEQPL